MIRFIFNLTVAALIFSFAQEANADSFYCGNRIVSTGKHKREVERLCGAPTYIDQHREEKTIRRYRRIVRRPKQEEEQSEALIDRQDQPERTRNLDNYRLASEHTIEVNIEEWTYNFGSQRFIRTLIFENGELALISTGGYGFDPSPENEPIVELGDSKAVVQMKYGPPTSTDTREESATEIHYRDEGFYLYAEECTRWINVDEWTYDFGPDRLMQVLTFRNNRLVRKD